MTTNVPGSVGNIVNGSNSTGLSASDPGTDISVANFSVVSSAPDSGKASFSTPWSVALTLTPSDIAGGAIGSPLTETFAGTLTASLSQNTALVAMLVGAVVPGSMLIARRRRAARLRAN